MKYKALQRFVLRELQLKLPAHYHYHHYGHTIEVVNTIDEMAQLANVDHSLKQLLKTAALLHDTGLMYQREDHENISVSYARNILPSYGYKSAETDLICTLIMATKMPQQPLDLLASMLCDADIDYLGTSSYFIKSHQLRLEWLEEKLMSDDLLAWYQYQLHFLSGHEYFTEIAKSRRQQGKLENIANLQRLLGV